MNSRRRAFTLVELLVVLGIIIVLVSIAWVVLGNVRGSALRAKQKFALTGIATALDAYKNDFGRYPQVPSTTPNAGPAVLAMALTGHGNANGEYPVFVPTRKVNVEVGEIVQTASGVGQQQYMAILRQVSGGTMVSPPDANYWMPFNFNDGADGFGMKRSMGQGRTYGPYIQVESYNMNGGVLRDTENRPILYFSIPANANPATSYVAQSTSALINADQNISYYRTRFNDAASLSLSAMRLGLGDYDRNGIINGNESAVITTPTQESYLLVTSGDDGFFGARLDMAPPFDTLNAADGKEVDDIFFSPHRKE